MTQFHNFEVKTPIQNLFLTILIIKLQFSFVLLPCPLFFVSKNQGVLKAPRNYLPFLIFFLMQSRPPLPSSDASYLGLIMTKMTWRRKDPLWQPCRLITKPVAGILKFIGLGPYFFPREPIFRGKFPDIYLPICHYR